MTKQAYKHIYKLSQQVTKYLERLDHEHFLNIEPIYNDNIINELTGSPDSPLYPGRPCSPGKPALP